MSVIKPALQHPDLIAYFAGANNYCWLHFRDGQKKLLAKPISYLETLLPGFVRVHKTILINPACVQSLHQPPRPKMSGEIRLTTGDVFPISRRRWPDVVGALQTQVAISPTVTPEQVTVKRPLPPPSTLKPYVMLVSDDSRNNELTKAAFSDRWQSHHFHVLNQSTNLIAVLSQLPVSELPALLFLDARTATQERLRVLQQLKASRQLNYIPVILLVQPRDESVLAGYALQANSVIAIASQSPTLTAIIERACNFWLRAVALPTYHQTMGQARPQ
ncbi:response regulator transcription factor [Spirosoma sp. KUDC1026]|uniref:response regulator transcription factor n=1 Tax=Spirosoma sp. KUDC1026 TaxID=2745947 RepID=UPI00159B9D3B|nr:LytTR family transcriptional regulator DNA-binding domain-containing protein [Spirosoma sp. KUDC1026]QKZ13923.1 LytTR family transcriptional regulator DNA-binding domain-containing protein [Spirosoma sp. KUDC1026]